MKELMKTLPILFNIVCSITCKLNAQKLFEYLECDPHLLRDGQVHYRIGTGGVLSIVMIVLLVISIMWILLNAKFLYQDKNQKQEYLMLSICFVVFMDVCWIAHFLKWFTLIAAVQGAPERRPPM